MDFLIFRQYASIPSVGGSLRHFNICKDLTVRGFTTWLIISSFNHGKKCRVRNNIFLPKIESIDGVNVVWLPSLAYRSNGFFRLLNILHYSFGACLAGLYIALIKNRSLVLVGSVAHVFSLFPAFLLSLFRKSNIFVIDFGELWPEVLILNGTISENSVVYKIIKSLMEFFSNRSDLILATSNDATNILCQKYPDKNVINFPPTLEPNLEFSKCDMDNERLVYFGSLDKTYPVLDFLVAMSGCNSENKLGLDVYGNGNDLDNLISFASKNKLDVRFFNFISSKELLPIISNYRGALIIEGIISYGTSNKLLDCLSIGMPFIYASPERKDVGTLHSCFATEDLTVFGLEKTINNFLESSINRKAVVLEQHSYLLKNYSRKVVMDCFLKSVNSLSATDNSKV
jgi:hypothetical protein